MITGITTGLGRERAELYTFVVLVSRHEDDDNDAAVRDGHTTNDYVFWFASAVAHGIEQAIQEPLSIQKTVRERLGRSLATVTLFSSLLLVCTFAG